MASKSRTRPCDGAQAKERLARAREFAEVAQLAADERDPQDQAKMYASAAGSLAVLAGIAASDAASCHVLREHSRGQDHRQAADLLKRITPGGDKAAKQLEALLNLKDKAQYGFLALSDTDLTKVMRRAQALIAFAEGTLQR